MPSSTPDDSRLLAQLEIEERRISAKRLRVQDRIDFMRSGAAVESDDHNEKLRQLEEEERLVSARRRELLEAIDGFRVRLGQQPGPRPRQTPLGG